MGQCSLLWRDPRGQSPHATSGFSVRGQTGTYKVYADDVLRRTWRCCCPAHARWPDTPCKHIKLVLRNGCLAVAPGGSAGRKRLGAVGVSITGSVPRLYTCTELPCECGEMMLTPKMRARDDAGHQIIEVQYDDGGKQYAYAWGGKRAKAVGDKVFIAPPSDQRQWSPGRQVIVVALESDWARAAAGRREGPDYLTNAPLSVR
jgi:hypothetical protein